MNDLLSDLLSDLCIFIISCKKLRVTRKYPWLLPYRTDFIHAHAEFYMFLTKPVQDSSLAP